MSSIGLLVTGIDLLPPEVTAALGLEPDQTWRRGDSKRVGDSTHEQGGWKKHLEPRDNGDPFADDLQTWVTLLGTKATELRKLQEAGLYCVLDCFISVSGAALVELEPQLQRDLADLGVEIKLTIWAGPNDG